MWPDWQKNYGRKSGYHLVSQEVGYGVVPMDAFDRKYREAVGRVCTDLASKSKKVIRVVCGIGTVIKMLKLILIRHGETQGNKLKRYIGKRTDEPLCPEAGNMLAQLAYPEVQAVYASPMIRCTQTAGILPGKS